MSVPGPLLVASAALLSAQLLATGPDAANDPSVLLAQRKLIARGYNPGLPDGILGDATRRALKEFQQDEGLPATRRLDRRTLEALGIENPAAGSSP